MRTAGAPGRYSPAEDDYLAQNYGRQHLADIAAVLGRAASSVTRRVHCLIRDGRLDASHGFDHLRWTAEDETYLLEHWGKYPATFVADNLGRSVNACVRRATLLGHSRRAAIYTANMVAAIFGVSHTVITGWIQEGVLRARRSAVNTGAGRRCWDVDDKDLARFIERYPWRYDYRRMEAGTYWRNLATAAHRRDPWLSVPEAARQLDVSASTIKRLLYAGQLTGERLPRSGSPGWRIPGSAIAQFRQTQAARSAQMPVERS